MFDALLAHPLERIHNASIHRQGKHGLCLNHETVLGSDPDVLSIHAVDGKRGKWMQMV